MGNIMLAANPTSAKQEPRFPIKRFYIRMEKTKFKQYQMRMHEFGKAFAFSMRIRPTSPDPYDIYFVYTRDDIDMSSANASDSGATDLKFSIGFYPKRDRSPPPPENVNVLVEGLKKFLAPVEGAVITEIASPVR
jgi:hypothetical protein